MDQNFLDLVQLFEEHKVKYLIIGGYAVSYYSEPRYTKDIDFWVECSLINSKRLYKALDEFGAPMSSIKPEDFSKPGTAYTAGLPPLRFDILTKVSGASFKTAYARKHKIKISEHTLYYVSLDILIKIKQAAGRPQDILDVQKLKDYR